jgi:hypothetical protein
MRTRLVLAVLALMSFLLPSQPAFALLSDQTALTICNPAPGGTPCLGSECTQLGVTTMDSDQKNLVACLKNDAGALVWKAMSGGSGGACYTDYSLAPGLPVGSPCTVSGFTVKGFLGDWGYCIAAAGNFYAGGMRPPGAGGTSPIPGPGKCSGGFVNYGTINGLAYLCCQN